MYFESMNCNRKPILFRTNDKAILLQRPNNQQWLLASQMFIISTTGEKEKNVKIQFETQINSVIEGMKSCNSYHLISSTPLKLLQLFCY